MCGRYTLFETDELADRFDVDEAEMDALRDDLKKRYNIGPSQIVPTVVQRTDKPHLELMRWGFMPVWAHDPKAVFKYKTFNTRSEDVFDKPTWKKAIRQQRCLVPSNGFYEWLALPDGKQPFFIKPKDQELFAFAGIYNTWKDSEGLEWGTYSILTTTPNQDMERIHNRMPVILKPDDESRWLEPSNETPETIADLLRPYEDGMLDIYEVSRDVNTTRVDNDTLVLPINTQ
ncbi:MAG: hypothetical protein JWM37_116 [Candidatus Saccharibacteria bacterium]|nr:hypothetical protein [Candidatus Saccharibacteria bacterium]